MYLFILYEFKAMDKFRYKLPERLLTYFKMKAVKLMLSFFFQNGLFCIKL